MGTSGTRMRALDGLLQQLGHEPAGSRAASPRLAALSPRGSELIMQLYGELGGSVATPTLRPGGWDLQYEDGLVVELDEQLHFNRYRGVTLRSGPVMPWSADYLAYVESGEGRCLKDSVSMAGKWSSAGAASLFGLPAPAGDFSGNGAPRWKQRALYDAMKDIAADEGSVHLVRLSIYDPVGAHTLDQVLEPKNPAQANLSALGLLLARRTAG